MSFPDLNLPYELPEFRVSDTPVHGLLAQAHMSLYIASHALHAVEHSDDARWQLASLCQTVIEGRRSTFILQKLSSRVEGWDAHWQPLREAMGSDSLMRYFVDLRNEIEKQGLPRAMVEYTHRETGEVLADVALHMRLDGIIATGAARPGTYEHLEDGQELRREDYVIRNIRLPDPPTTHLGAPITVPLIFANLGMLYLTHLHSQVLEPTVEKYGLPTTE